MFRLMRTPKLIRKAFKMLLDDV